MLAEWLEKARQRRLLCGPGPGAGLLESTSGFCHGPAAGPSHHAASLSWVLPPSP